MFLRELPRFNKFNKFNKFNFRIVILSNVKLSNHSVKLKTTNNFHKSASTTGSPQDTRSEEVSDVVNDLIKHLNSWSHSIKTPDVVTPEKLFVQELGSGTESIVFLHGLYQTGDDWLPILKHLNSKEFEFVIPDLLGHGRSSCTPYIKYTPNNHLYYLQRDVTNNIGVRSGSIVGHSRHSFRLVGVGVGAILALEMALLMPNRIISLHLISTPCFESEEEASLELFSHLSFILKPLNIKPPISLALSSCNEILKPMIELSRMTDKFNIEKPSSVPERVDAFCSTLNECLIKHRIEDTAYDVENLHIEMNLIEGSNDCSNAKKRIERFLQKHYNYCNLINIPDAENDILRTNPEYLGRILNEEFLSK